MQGVRTLDAVLVLVPYCESALDVSVSVCMCLCTTTQTKDLFSASVGVSKHGALLQNGTRTKTALRARTPWLDVRFRVQCVSMCIHTYSSPSDTCAQWDDA